MGNSYTYLPETTKQATACVGLGFRTERTDLATVVYAAGPVSLFTITGGNVAMTMLRAEIEVLALAADAAVPRYGITTAAPYAAATVYFCAAATTIASYAIGSSITVVGDALATAALKQSTIGPTLWGAAQVPLILTPGIVIVTNAVPMTGQATSIIRHQMWWFPMDTDSTVVAS